MVFGNAAIHLLDSSGSTGKRYTGVLEDVCDVRYIVCFTFSNTAFPWHDDMGDNDEATGMSCYSPLYARPQVLFLPQRAITDEGDLRQ